MEAEFYTWMSFTISVKVVPTHGGVVINRCQIVIGHQRSHNHDDEAP